MIHDLRVALRSLRGSPWYAATIIGVLAGGIAVTTLTFAVVDGVLFKPLPYPRADELYFIRADATAAPQVDPPPVSWDDVLAWREAVPDLVIGVASVAATREEQVAVRDFYSASIDERFLEVLRVQPLAGGFEAADFSTTLRTAASTRGAPRLISHALWHALHRGNPQVVGQPTVVSETMGSRAAVRVAGVLPASFVYPVSPGQPQPDVLVPLSPSRVASGVHAASLQAIARIERPGDVVRVRERLLAATRELAGRLSSRPPHTAPAIVIAAEPRRVFDQITLIPLAGHLWRAERPAFAAVASAAGLLLLLVAMNVAGLAAARSVERQRQAAVRRALGASSWRLVRSQLAELAWLVVPACGLALLATKPLLVWTVDLLPASLAPFEVPSVDARVFGAAATLGFLTLLVVALWPVRVTVRANAAGALGRATPQASRRVRSGRGVVAAQTAAGFVLVTAGMLTGASLAVTWTEDTGYDRQRLGLLEVFARFYDTREHAVDQLNETWDRLRRTPGVSDVAVSSIQPLFESNLPRPYTVWVPEAVVEAVPDVSSRLVSSNYFEVMGLELVEGTWPDAAVWNADGAVALVSESAARLWWPDRSAVGRVLARAPARARTADAPKIVVGVVRDARYSALDRAPLADVYVPNPISRNVYGVYFLVRTSTSVDSVMPGLLQAVSTHRLRVAQASSFEAALFKSIRHRALPAWLFGLLGGSGLIVLGTGVIGLLAMSVSQRRHEVGIRLALGGTRATIVRLLAQEQLRPVLVGMGVGAVVAVWAATLIESQLYGVSAHHPGVWVLSSLTVLGTACVGALIPSIRSARVSPVEALRAE